MSSKAFIPIFILVILCFGPFTYSQSNIVESASGFLTSMPPESPILSDPADQSTDVSPTVDLRWFSQIHTSSFSLQLSASPDLSNSFIEQADLTDTVYNVSGLENNTTYYWQVKASNLAGDGDPSPIRAFTTIVAIPDPPSLKSPVDQAVDIPVNTDLEWYSSVNATHYSLQVSTSPDFQNLVIDNSNLPLTTFNFSGFEHHTTYYWRVNASNVVGESSYSSVWQYTTIVALPAQPALAEPADQAVDVLVVTDLTWYAVPDAEYYHLLLSASPDLSDPIVDQSDLVDTVYTVSGLDNNTTYYWQVTARNVAVDEDPSSSWSFTTTSSTSVGEDGMNRYLLNIYPNPFNSTVRIEYQLPEESVILITIYNILGKAVEHLDAGLKPAGRYQLEWIGKDPSGKRIKAGLYLCQLKTGKAIVTHKMILIH